MPFWPLQSFQPSGMESTDPRQITMPPIGNVPSPESVPPTERLPFTEASSVVKSAEAVAVPEIFAVAAAALPATVRSPLADTASSAIVATGTASSFWRGEISAPDPATVSPRWSGVPTCPASAFARPFVGVPSESGAPPASESATLKSPASSSSTGKDRPQSASPPTSCS